MIPMPPTKMEPYISGASTFCVAAIKMSRWAVGVRLRVGHRGRGRWDVAGRVERVEWKDERLWEVGALKIKGMMQDEIG